MLLDGETQAFIVIPGILFFYLFIVFLFVKFDK